MDLPPQPPSKRFLGPDELGHRGTVRPETGTPRPEKGLSASRAGELYAEGPWQSILSQLEREGWNLSQIEMLHNQLRQGWPLQVAKKNVSVMSGHCPLRSRPQS